MMIVVDWVLTNRNYHLGLIASVVTGKAILKDYFLPTVLPSQPLRSSDRYFQRTWNMLRAGSTVISRIVMQTFVCK